MQEIFILRHAHAQDISDRETDFERKLTEEGIKKTRKISLFFDSLEKNLDLVLSSPFLRAKETASIFVQNLKPKPELKIVDFLSAGTSSKEIAKGLLPYNSFEKLLLVGHAPDLEMFLGRLIGAERVILKRGALAKVRLNSSIELSGELIWLVIPRLIKNLKIKEKV